MNQATHTTWLALYHLFLRDSWRIRPVRPPQVALSCRFGSFLPSSFGCSQVVGGSMGNHGQLGVKADAKSNDMELIWIDYRGPVIDQPGFHGMQQTRVLKTTGGKPLKFQGENIQVYTGLSIWIEKCSKICLFCFTVLFSLSSSH